MLLLKIDVPEITPFPAFIILLEYKFETFDIVGILKIVFDKVDTPLLLKFPVRFKSPRTS
jgi:hypothetical protein